jgi:putative lipoprotein
MKAKLIKGGMGALTLGICLACSAQAQEPATPEAAPVEKHNNVRKAIEYKQFNYTCEGGVKLAVYLHGQAAKVRYGDQTYFMKQTMSADGNRYSDGKVVWWGKGNGGFLQEDTPDGNGKMIVKDCVLDKPLNTEQVTGTVTYLQRIALPTNAVIQVQLADVSRADAPADVVAEQSINLGQRQVPVPFTLNVDQAKVDAKHTYAVSAKITVGSELRFVSDRPYPVLTKGNPKHVEIIVRQASAPGGR